METGTGAAQRARRISSGVESVRWFWFRSLIFGVQGKDCQIWTQAVWSCLLFCSPLPQSRNHSNLASIARRGALTTPMPFREREFTWAPPCGCGDPTDVAFLRKSCFTEGLVQRVASGSHLDLLGDVSCVLRACVETYSVDMRGHEGAWKVFDQDE